MKKNLTNKEVAEILLSVAAAYEVKGESRFKILAYQRVASSVEHLNLDVIDLWEEGRLHEIPGAGASIVQHLDELFKTGKVRHFEEAMRGLPPAMFTFISIPGIGPKTAFRLCRSLGIWESKSAILKLKKDARLGKIRDIPGFGLESEKKILESLLTMTTKKEKKERIPLYKADLVVNEMVSYLKELKLVKDVIPLGSLRRRAATIGDLDIAVACDRPKEVIKWFVKHPKIRKIISSGDMKASVIMASGNQIDLYAKKTKSFGSLVQHFTGSKLHNIHLREFSLSKGLSLSENGIKNKSNRKLSKFGDEESFYNFLGMEWIPPEIREDTGEIEASIKHALPELVELQDIKGDLQLHSDFNIEPSHDLGMDNFSAMARKGLDLGYSYIGFTEHNPSLSKHSLDDIISILSKKGREIDKLNYTNNNCSNDYSIIAFNGLEIDISASGRLSMSEGGLRSLDYAIGSIHSNFSLSRKEMTKRVIDGMSNSKLIIFAHPTGRIINNRDGYDLDWDKIFDFFLKNHKALEINAYPERLDLPDIIVREAVKAGVKLIINTDSHNISQMEYMRYGVSVARRGWAERSDIVNTWSLKEFCEYFRIDNPSK